MDNLAIKCKVCDNGSLKQTSVYKTSKPIAIMGYILMIPSALVLGVTTLITFGGMLMSASDKTSDPTVKGGVAALGIGVWLVIAFICLPTFIVGFLLRLKKSVLKCDTCGSVIAQQ
jgi:hypothetical protein